MALTGLGIATICSALMATGTWTSQTPTKPTLGINEITAEIGSDADAREVVSNVLSHAMATRGGRRVFFLARQLRSEWLPVVQGVEFVRLSDAEIAAHVLNCGSYWIISRLERAANVVSMRLSAACDATTLGYMVSLEDGEWRLGPPGSRKGGGSWVPGTGSGFVGDPPPECSCR
jgi:hypothetical protein